MKEVSFVIRGTCQQFKFHLPYTKAQLKTVEIVFWQPENYDSQNNPFEITKTLEHCVGNSDDKELIVELTQTETLAFHTKRKAWVQFRGLTTEDFAFASKPMSISVYPIKKETVLQ